LILASKALYRGDSTIVKVLFITIAYHFSSRLSFESGGVLNPAITIGLELWQAIYNTQWRVIYNFWVFLIGEFAGGFAAAFFFQHVIVRFLAFEDKTYQHLSNKDLEHSDIKDYEVKRNIEHNEKL